MQRITPFLWFDKEAEEAMKFYTSVFKDSSTGNIARYPKASPYPEGSVMSASFTLEGLDFIALNGGPEFTFNPALSFFVSCRTLAEIDACWARLSEGGKILMEFQKYPFSEKYGWLSDRFGVSWQLMLGGDASRITPFLMFVGAQAGRAEKAATFYATLFKDSRILRMERYPAGMGEAEGNVVHGDFLLDGQGFMVMDSGGPHDFAFNPAISLFVDCRTQAEVDSLWERLCERGRPNQCGWLTDEFGVSWQIVPRLLSELLADPDPVKAGRVMAAMLKMSKIDIAGLERAYAGN
jgi:predicted 3-demethylubiquinone-9 3-methyltransferase (glyoxalase superfamily)